MPTVTTLSGFSFAVDLETRDFEAYRDDVLRTDGLADAYLPDWTDRSELDLGVALTEVFAFFADNLGYYQDRCANEALWPSITQRRSIIEQSKLIGYELRPPTSAQVELTIEVNAAGTLNKGQLIKVKDPTGDEQIDFELLQDVTFSGPFPETQTGVLAIHGTTIQDPLRTSVGAPDQFYELGSRPLSLNPTGELALEVYITEAGPEELWAAVDNFIEAEPTDKVYAVRTDENDVSRVVFGDGINGKIPDAGVDNIRFVYRIGGGTVGNEVGPDKLTVMPNAPAFVVSVTNPDKPTGGRNKETIEEAKEMAPRTLKALERCVSHEDYETAARRIPGIRDAFAFRGEGAFEEHLIVASSGENPVPTGTWDPLTEQGVGMLGAVGTYITPRKTTPVILIVEACKVVEIYLAMTVYLFPNVVRDRAFRTIADAVLETISPNTLKLGEQIPLSLVYDLVEDLQGVDYLDINQFQRLPFSRSLQTSIILPSDVYAKDVIVNSLTEDDEYYVYFLNSTTFTVTSKLYGLEPTTGTINVPYEVQKKCLTFTMTYSAQAPTSADRLVIKTGQYFGNINPDRDVIGRLFQDNFTLLLEGGRGTI
jgi:hypothetical protein